MNKGRKISGGKYHQNRKKKLFEKSTQENSVILGETKRKSIKTTGGNEKTILLKTNSVNIVSEKGSKTKKTEIKNVIETPHNNFLARQNRLSKGTIIETSLGKARITNRPSQEGHVNAILIKE
jgi:small subunit ribosomal protein S8e